MKTHIRLCSCGFTSTKGTKLGVSQLLAIGVLGHQVSCNMRVDIAEKLVVLAKIVRSDTLSDADIKALGLDIMASSYSTARR